MHADRPPVGQTLGLGGADVVGSQVLHQVGAHQPGDVGHRRRRQHERRHDQLVPGALGGRHREPAEPNAEDQLGQAADDEDRDGDQQQGADGHQVVDELAAPDARQHARGDADDGLDDQGHQAQLEGDREPDRSSSTTLLPKKLVPRSPWTRLPMYSSVLHQERIVQVVLRPERRDVARWARPLTAAADGRVAEGEDRDVDDEGDADDDRDHLEQAPDDVLAHSELLSCDCGRAICDET